MAPRQHTSAPRAARHALNPTLTAKLQEVPILSAHLQGAAGFWLTAGLTDADDAKRPTPSLALTHTHMRAPPWWGPRPRQNHLGGSRRGTVRGQHRDWGFSRFGGRLCSAQRPKGNNGPANLAPAADLPRQGTSSLARARGSPPWPNSETNPAACRWSVGLPGLLFFHFLRR